MSSINKCYYNSQFEFKEHLLYSGHIAMRTLVQSVTPISVHAQYNVFTDNNYQLLLLYL